MDELPIDTYLDYVARGPCEVREKIRNDTFRCAVRTLNPYPSQANALAEAGPLRLIADSRSAFERTCLFACLTLSSGAAKVRARSHP